MSIILSDDIKENIRVELASATQSVHIISAFCKENAFEFINDNINKNIRDKDILVRFKLSDIVSGATDFNLYNLCKSNKWNLYFNLDLHAKTYIFDKKRCILGSANLTNKGFSIKEHGNEEISGLFDLDTEDVCKIEELYRNSIFMTDEIYNKMANEVANISDNRNTLEWSQIIIELCNMKQNTFFSHELPNREVPSEYINIPIDFLEVGDDWTYEEVKIKFKHSKVYRWLSGKLLENEGEMFFGEISTELHKVLISDPKPYRKEVKEYVANLLGWIKYFGYTEIIVDRPSYSQRVRLTGFR